ncbi:hypothetical protein TcG_03786, partial [Trypanosoma cruzi]
EDLQRQLEELRAENEELRGEHEHKTRGLQEVSEQAEDLQRQLEELRAENEQLRSVCSFGDRGLSSVGKVFSKHRCLLGFLVLVRFCARMRRSFVVLYVLMWRVQLVCSFRIFMVWSLVQRLIIVMWMWSMILFCLRTRLTTV